MTDFSVDRARASTFLFLYKDHIYADPLHHDSGVK